MDAEKIYKESRARQIQRDKQEAMDLNLLQAQHKQLQSVVQKQNDLDQVKQSIQREKDALLGYKDRFLKFNQKE